MPRFRWGRRVVPVVLAVLLRVRAMPRWMGHVRDHRPVVRVVAVLGFRVARTPAGPAAGADGGNFWPRSFLSSRSIGWISGSQTQEAIYLRGWHTCRETIRALSRSH